MDSSAGRNDILEGPLGQGERALSSDGLKNPDSIRFGTTGLELSALPVPVVPTSVQGHYHTGTSSNRRRLMYAQFVSVFEFRIQMAHLPKSRWLSGWLKGNDVGNAVDRTRHSWNHHCKAL
ncbi:hypothetical protein HZH68_007498 [Vespula germanica]|uniref:Uncharacterized protein n=1 Tax=Vespula germanica TaxID=30212 RepID=A0A834K7P2_VESGE|nr:hypothetical protein HZH68_007498 [Vespula germanica]